MDKFEQQRLEYLFEIEAIKCPLMGYIAPGVNLKLVTELGYKDQNGNKRRYYEEYKRRIDWEYCRNKSNVL